MYVHNNMVMNDATIIIKNTGLILPSNYDNTYRYIIRYINTKAYDSYLISWFGYRMVVEIYKMAYISA